MIVLVPAEIHEEFSADALEIAPNVRLYPYREEGDTPEGLMDASGILRWVNGRQFSRLVTNGPQIRWLHTASAGVDHVLTPEVNAKEGLQVTDSGTAFEIGIPEFVLAWILTTAHRLPELRANQQARCWQPLKQQELYQQTIGIIGLGPIGRGIAVRAKAFGMHTLGLRQHAEAVPWIDKTLTGLDGMAHLLAESDWVVLAAALTERSRAMIGAEQLRLMKPTARLINIARGGLVDEPALIAALQESRIAGACLDVFQQEPLPPESPLWEMPQVFISPHNSSGMSDALRGRQKAIFLENLRRFVAGEPLLNVVNRALGY